MKYVTQFLGSGLLILGGVLVLTFSLHFAHLQQTRVSAYTPPTVNPTPGPLQWTDADMPGTPLYLWQRSQDKLHMWQANADETTSLYLAHVEHRAQAAAYAFSVGNEQQALTTLHKSYGYLHKAVHACQPPLVHDVACATQIDTFRDHAVTLTQVAQDMSQEATHDEVRAKADLLVENVGILRQQFSF